jgi:glycosyltransferase involved in cell wall biosynthesis
MTRSVTASDLVAGCSTHVVETARKCLANTGVPFIALPNGAPVERLAQVRAPRVRDKVLFVGRVSPEKGVHTLLEAWPRVLATRPDARLDIVGPASQTPRELLVDLSNEPEVRGLSRFYSGGSHDLGSYQTALRALVDPTIAHTVTFADYEPYERLGDRYASASLLVNPSLSESFGMSLVEALAAGTPVVATRVGGMSEIVEATGGGVLVDRENPDALAEAIIRLLADREAAVEMGRRGARRVAELYPWARVAQLTREIHDTAMSARAAKRARSG